MLFRSNGPYGEGFYIWDLADPENPQRLGHYKTGGKGTHRNYYAGGNYVHTTALPDGYDGHIYQIVDIADPANPKEVSRWWRKGCSWWSLRHNAARSYQQESRRCIHRLSPT